MRKWLILGLIISLSLPAAAWGQDAGEAYVGQKIQKEQAPSGERGPMSCPYPPETYPLTPEGPPMTERVSPFQAELPGNQANLEESREESQEEEPAQEEVQKKTIEPSPQAKQE
jgi:hypothetical protein